MNAHLPLAPPGRKRGRKRLTAKSVLTKKARLELRFDARRVFPVGELTRPARRKRGVHASICRALMAKPKVWARVSKDRLSLREEQSLQTAIYTSTRFGLHFQIAHDERKRTWVRFVGRADVKVKDV